MTDQQIARLEHLSSIEFPTPAEFAEFRDLLALASTLAALSRTTNP